MPDDWNEHLAWAKQRAHEYVDRGELLDALSSMGSDLDKHRNGEGVKYSAAFLYGALAAIEQGPDAMHRWIDGVV